MITRKDCIVYEMPSGKVPYSTNWQNLLNYFGSRESILPIVVNMDTTDVYGFVHSDLRKYLKEIHAEIEMLDDEDYVLPDSGIMETKHGVQIEVITLTW